MGGRDDQAKRFERRRDEMIRVYADVARHVQIAIAVWDVLDPDDPTCIRLVAFNPAAEAMAGTSFADAVGKPLREVVPRVAGGEIEELICEVARSGGVREISRQSRPSDSPGRAVIAKVFSLGGTRVGVAVEDVTEPTQARRMREQEHRIFEMIASGKDLRDILAAVVLAVEERSGGGIGSVLLMDPDGRRIRHGSSPNLPEPYTRAIDGAPIGPVAGSCGTAAWRRAPVYVEDIETDALWADYRALARSYDLRACWSTPMVATDGRVLGTFALYYRDPRLPAEADRELLDRATHLAGIAIERQQKDDQLRALSARVESVREEERTGIAREIHDDLGQALTAFKLDLAWLSRRLTAEPSSPAPPLLEKIAAMSAMTDDIIGRVRRISAELRPGVLDDLGLSAAIEWQGEEFERRTGAPCRVVAHVADNETFASGVSTAAFRILQEALTNVARHAGASQVDVTLKLEAGLLVLEVCDDGVGISDEALTHPRSLGLLGIRERARALGGMARVSGRAPHGTVVRVELPVAAGHGGVA